MLTIFHTEASLGWGGQEIRILKEAECMRKRGHRVIIIAEETSGILGRAKASGFEVVSMSFLKKDYPASFFRLLKLMKEFAPDVVNTHSSRDSWLAGLAARASSAQPALIRTRHLSTPVAKGIASSIVYKSLPHRVITTAEAIRDNLIRINGCLPDRIVSIPTGVDLVLFNPLRHYKDIRAELSLPDDTLLAGMVSVIRSWKGHDCFVEAAGILSKKFPDARFIITGDGPRREAIEKMVKDKNLSGHVLMLGHREDIPDIMAFIDILVQPSYGNEGVPQSLLQAMAMETPVVVSDIRPLLEVVTDKVTGLVAKTKDPESLAEKIEALMRDKALRDRLGAAGRRLVVERFSMENMADAVERTYEGVFRELRPLSVPTLERGNDKAE
ncbi:MAG: glycosyltransferase family 4 protein [Deltaproteobacteria bacterium]|nr:glycosyltransferase family 4 protein [Deltaproteobacteria bacterium]